MPGLLDARVKLLDFGCSFEKDFSSASDCSGVGWRELITGVFEDL